jgi:hypothetical protein
MSETKTQKDSLVWKGKNWMRTNAKGEKEDLLLLGYT